MSEDNGKRKILLDLAVTLDGFRKRLVVEGEQQTKICVFQNPTRIRGSSDICKR
jgi:hypothetical protein